MSFVKGQFSFDFVRGSGVAVLRPVSIYVEPQDERFSARADGDIIYFSRSETDRFIMSRRSASTLPTYVTDIDVASQVMQDSILEYLLPSDLPAAMAAAIACTGLNGEDRRVSVSTELGMSMELVRVSIKGRSGGPIRLSFPIVREKGALRTVLSTNDRRAEAQA